MSDDFSDSLRKIYDGHVESIFDVFTENLQHRSEIAEIYISPLQPLARLKVSEWADEYRILTSVDTDEAGPWRTDRTPYLREIMDALSVLDPTREVVFMKGAQVGATQAGNNFVGYVIHHAPGPILIVQPTVDMAKRNSRQRIEPMIESTPALKAKFSTKDFKRSGSNTMLSKEFPGGILIMTGSNSASSLRSMSARYLFLDEVDGYPADIDNEGDPVSIAEARTRNFHRAKIYKVSTPTVHSLSRIEAAFNQGDQRYYYVPCPMCNHYQILRFGGPECDFGLKWEKLKNGKVGAEVRYMCEKCHKLFKEHHKTQILQLGEWRPHNAEGAKAGVRSYHLSSIYSPYGWYSWRDLRDDFLESKKFPLRLKTFVNTVLGETFKDEITKVDGGPLYNRREEYPKTENGTRLVPASVVLMTGSVDVQSDRLEMSVYGWGAHKDFGRGAHEECWAIETQIIPGNPAEREIWDELWRRMTVQRAFEFGRMDYVRAWCVDAGYQTTQVYNFCRPRYRVLTPDGRRMWVFPTLGRAGPGMLWPRAPSRNNQAKIVVWTLKVDAGKETLYTRLRTQEPGPGYIHFPVGEEFSERFFHQLTAEELTTTFDPKGFPVRRWFLPRAGMRNEQLDLWVGAYAAFQGLLAHGLDFAREAEDISRGAALAAAQRGVASGASGATQSPDQAARSAKALRKTSTMRIPSSLGEPEGTPEGSPQLRPEHPGGLDLPSRGVAPIAPSSPRPMRRRRTVARF